MSVACAHRMPNPWSWVGSWGTSKDAARLLDYQRENRDERFITVAPYLLGVYHELARVALEHSNDNWDGYGARPVTPEAVQAAFDLLRALPTTMPQPEIGVDPNGRMVFEWYRGPHKVFSISAEKGNELTYSGLFPSGEVSGTDRFDADSGLPDHVFVHIARVLG